MNQQQRAGKHPSFFRETKPFSRQRCNGPPPCLEKQHRSRGIHNSWSTLVRKRNDDNDGAQWALWALWWAPDWAIQEFLDYMRRGNIRRTKCGGDKRLEEAILFSQWSVIREFLVGMHRECVSGRLLDAAVILALDMRHWGTLEDFVDKGGSLATVCARYKVSLDQQDAHGDTPLHEAVMCRRGTMVRLLLLAGARLDVVNKAGDTPLHTAVKCRRYPSWGLYVEDGVGDDSWDIVNLIVLLSGAAAGAVASRRTGDGSTLLHDLIALGQTDLLQTLLLMKADPLVVDTKGNSLMMAAVNAGHGQENLMRVLIQAGMSTHQPALSGINSPACRGQSYTSPMHRAVTTGQLRLARMLYASGAASQQEISHISRYCYGLAWPSPGNLEEVRRFLEEVSSHPRSLRDLCALTVSHCLGCGPDRGQRAAGAGLPPALCRLVLHDHVVHPDFVKDMSPDPTVSPLSCYFSRLDRFRHTFNLNTYM